MIELICAIRLTEIGPRMQFELVKVEADFFAGDVLFHAYGMCLLAAGFAWLL